MTEERIAVLDPTVLHQYAGTFAPDLAVPEVGEPLPLGWEALLFPFDSTVADLRPDGTPSDPGPGTTGLARRMYAGEETTVTRPLRVGDRVTRRTTRLPAGERDGRSGRLVFVDLEREHLVEGTCAVRSTWHDVFMAADRVDDPVAERPARDERVRTARADAAWMQHVELDARQLFRFSAITFNTHRVHYDRAWTREVEHLPDLLVHGPLVRLLVADAVSRHAPSGRRAVSLSVRMAAPAFVDRPLDVIGHADDTLGTSSEVLVAERERLVATARIEWSTDPDAI